MIAANNIDFDLNYSIYYGVDFLFSTKHASAIVKIKIIISTNFLGNTITLFAK